jgi:hypothetical protein
MRWRWLASVMVSLLSWMLCWVRFHGNCWGWAVRCPRFFPQPAITFPDLFGSVCCGNTGLATFSTELSMILVPGLIVFLLITYVLKK